MESLVYPHILRGRVENLDDITVQDISDNKEPILMECRHLLLAYVDVRGWVMRGGWMFCPVMEGLCLMQ